MEKPSSYPKEAGAFRLNETGDSITLKEWLKLAGGLLSFSRLKLIPSVVELILSCNNHRLVQGNGIYEGYFFGGKTPLIKRGLSSCDIDVFQSEEIIHAIISQGNRFRADPEASRLLRQLVGKVIAWYSIDGSRLDDAYESSRAQNKSLVLLGNHLSHLDAPVLDYILREEWYNPRFVCGAFMFYNEHVRPFTVAFDTIFVFGPKDQKNLVKSLLEGKDKTERKATMALLKSFQDCVSESVANSRNKKEIVVLFPYAGRAKEELWCKLEGIPSGMQSLLSDQRNMFCTMSSFGQRDAIPGGGGGSVLRTFSMIESIHPHVAIGEKFVGGKKTLEEIHTSMFDIAEKWLAEYNFRKRKRK